MDSKYEYNATATNSQSCYSNLGSYGGPLLAYTGCYRRSIVTPIPASPMPAIFLALGKPHNVANVPQFVPSKEFIAPQPYIAYPQFGSLCKGADGEMQTSFRAVNL